MPNGVQEFYLGEFCATCTSCVGDGLGMMIFIRLEYANIQGLAKMAVVRYKKEWADLDGSTETQKLIGAMGVVSVQDEQSMSAFRTVFGCLMETLNPLIRNSIVAIS